MLLLSLLRIVVVVENWRYMVKACVESCTVSLADFMGSLNTASYSGPRPMS